MEGFGGENEKEGILFILIREEKEGGNNGDFAVVYILLSISLKYPYPYYPYYPYFCLKHFCFHN